MTQTLVLHWEHRSDTRYYLIMLYRDLLGDWIPTKFWGGAGRTTAKHPLAKRGRRLSG